MPALDSAGAVRCPLRPGFREERHPLVDRHPPRRSRRLPPSFPALLPVLSPLRPPGERPPGPTQGSGPRAAAPTGRQDTEPNTQQSPMAVVIRMKRTGRRNRPCYRISVADSRPRDSRVLETLGLYDPVSPDEEKQATLKTERAQEWLRNGASRRRPFTDLQASGRVHGRPRALEARKEGCRRPGRKKPPRPPSAAQPTRRVAPSGRPLAATSASRRPAPPRRPRPRPTTRILRSHRSKTTGQR